MLNDVLAMKGTKQCQDLFPVDSFMSPLVRSMSGRKYNLRTVPVNHLQTDR